MTSQLLADLDKVEDPAEKAQKALALIEEARTLMDRAANVRARAALELYLAHGAPKAARLLGTSRMNLYRILGQIPEVRQQRLSRTLEIATAGAVIVTASAAGTDQSSQERVISGAVSRPD